MASELAGPSSAAISAAARANAAADGFSAALRALGPPSAAAAAGLADTPASTASQQVAAGAGGGATPADPGQVRSHQTCPRRRRVLPSGCAGRDEEREASKVAGENKAYQLRGVWGGRDSRALSLNAAWVLQNIRRLLASTGRSTSTAPRRTASVVRLRLRLRRRRCRHHPPCTPHRHQPPHTRVGGNTCSTSSLAHIRQNQLRACWVGQALQLGRTGSAGQTPRPGRSSPAPVANADATAVVLLHSSSHFGRCLDRAAATVSAVLPCVGIGQAPAPAPRPASRTASSTAAASLAAQSTRGAAVPERGHQPRPLQVSCWWCSLLCLYLSLVSLSLALNSSFSRHRCAGVAEQEDMTQQDNKDDKVKSDRWQKEEHTLGLSLSPCFHCGSHVEDRSSSFLPL